MREPLSDRAEGSGCFIASATHVIQSPRNQYRRRERRGTSRHRYRSRHPKCGLSHLTPTPARRLGLRLSLRTYRFFTAPSIFMPLDVSGALGLYFPRAPSRPMRAAPLSPLHPFEREYQSRGYVLLPIRANWRGRFPLQRGGSRGATPKSEREGEAYPLRHDISATQVNPHFFSLLSGHEPLSSASTVRVASSTGVEPIPPTFRVGVPTTLLGLQGFEPCLFRPIRPKCASIHPFYNTDKDTGSLS